jgi:MOSC domain-containing protein YiiM
MPDAVVLSVNVGVPRRVDANEKTVLTGIFKFPVRGRVRVRGYNLEGDRQADLRVHGGPSKAVYLYPSEHYAFWKAELGLSVLDYGAFGENLTTEGLLEEEVRIGDQFRVGSIVLQVTQPRMPCFKLGLRFGRSDMVRRFWESGRSGMYFSIVKRGDVGQGEKLVRVASGPEEISVADVVRLYTGKEWRDEMVARALRSPLHGSWKRDIQSRLTEGVP